METFNDRWPLLLAGVGVDGLPLRLIGLDIYRDGGSLGASFLRADGLDCILFFKVSGISSVNGPPVFRAPHLWEQIPGSYTSPVTGTTDHVTAQEEHEIHWDQSLAILRELEAQVAGLVTEYRAVFPIMLSAAANQGRSAF